MTQQPVTPVPAAPVGLAQDRGYVDWPAILIGGVVASGVGFVFTTFGLALGLTMISPYEGDGSATAKLIAIGSWIVWTTVSSVMAGSYIAGRMRRRIEGTSPDETGVRDGVHGLAVWGVALLLGAMVLSGSVSSTLDAASDMSASVAAVGETITGQEAAGTAPVAGADAATLDADAAARAETARKYAILSAFILAAAQLIAGAGAYWAAGMGGQHRDDQRVFARFGRWT
ncbi:hypothetical protein [Pararhodobacter zhoushanensis]|uniref:PhnA-like protein n=1 Tax=Pararhodobacter zhoushanensis TaxID=2479545 RepID=A0ABT3H534_9RHOB|nr:hypothetical protein [Pararhodobacter zhoushanensis]MCW1934892.1 hypothetical protein [Pararhodobacter zhoushanensis]